MRIGHQKTLVYDLQVKGRKHELCCNISHILKLPQTNKVIFWEIKYI